MANLSYSNLRARIEDRRKHILGHIEKHSHDILLLEQKTKHTVIPALAQAQIAIQKARYEAAKDKYIDAVALWEKAKNHWQNEKR
ncbi:hypothetical protein E8E11_008914 [Didymella keratinophila]|nr:hypothetical protein E8E11_008914 [Didymella keratinophila]